MDTQRYYITTSIPYVNAKPHIGFAIELLYADVLARYYRREGYDVLFSTGTDEHGQKIQETAEAAGITPQEQVDKLSESFRLLLPALNISTNDFVRTTEERHKKTVHALWDKLLASGDVEKDIYEGLYCVGCESYKTEKELVDGRCPNHSTPLQTIREENYFFRLSRYQDRLLEWYETHEDFVIPKAKFNEIKEMVKNGLEDVSVTREKQNLSWGIPVPTDDDHVMYVWFEAVMNYVTAAQSADGGAEKWWPADMHIVGKDINRFHSVLWPAMLMAAGEELPQHIGVHGFITVDGQKMSKSIGNVIDPLEIVDQYGTDPVRYFFMREIPLASDGDFSHDRMKERYSADLANGIGNLLSRVTNMVEKYFDGKVDAQPHTGGYAEGQKAEYTRAMHALEFHKALDAVWQIVDEANEYIEEQQPWKLAKSDTEQLNIVLAHLLYCLELIADWLVPFIPETAEKIGMAIHGENITKSQPLFPRLEK